MFLCYIDESGTSQISGDTSHFILAGIAIPIHKWKQCEKEISDIKLNYQIQNFEIHTAWMLRKYIEQSTIQNFENLDYSNRRSEVLQIREKELNELGNQIREKINKKKSIKSQNQSNLENDREIKKLDNGIDNLKKRQQNVRQNYKKTISYVHLSFDERKKFIHEIAQCVSNWDFARLFAECVDKAYFAAKPNETIDKQAFEQVVTRFEKFLQAINSAQDGQSQYGLLVHDNNPAISRKHTNLMKEFHDSGTLWTNINNIFETPFFVDSELTEMVQIADLCAYALRRYLENHENALFDLIFNRADRRNMVKVGVRHYTHRKCSCKICTAHKKVKTRSLFNPS